VNSKVILENLKTDEVSFLVLVQVLGQYIRTLSMSLSPFVVLNIKELEAQNTHS
jgi:hypothetical protein